MQNTSNIIDWAEKSLLSKGYRLRAPSEAVLTTPWSNIIRFPTSKGYIYLKKSPPAISVEPRIIQVMADQLQADVPFVIDINDDLHCFLMEDAGQNLRQYLKADFQPSLLCQAIKQYAAIQRSTEDHIQPYLALGVPDWRLDKLPALYDNILDQEALLKSDGLTDKELKKLHDLSPKFSEQCERLSQYQVPETIAIYDINTNNVLLDTNTQKMTFIDWGEAVITYPFFSLHTYLHQATAHHPVKEFDKIYHQLQEASLENWLGLETKDRLLEAFMLAKEFWPIYSVLSMCRLINIIGLEPFNSFYASRPNRISNFLKDYISLVEQKK